MVLQTERYPGGYQQQSYTVYQESEGRYSNFPGITTGHTDPYSTYPQLSAYPSGHAPHHQSGWSNGGDYHANGANHYPGAGIVPPVKNAHGGYGDSYNDNSYGLGSPYSHGSPHGNSYGSPHGHSHGNPYGDNHGSPFGHSLGSPYGRENSHGHGGTNLFATPHHSYGSGRPNYAQSPGGINHGYQKPSWILKGLDDDE